MAKKPRAKSVATDQRELKPMNTSHTMSRHAMLNSTRMAEAAGFDPQALLTKPLDEIKPPIQLPVGGYVGIATKREFDKAKNEKASPLVRFEVVATEPLPDVDEDAFALATDEARGGKKLADNPQRLEFWLTPDAVYRLKEFGEEHCGIDQSEASNLAELIELIIGRPFVFVLEQQPNKKNPERPYINIVRTAKVPE